MLHGKWKANGGTGEAVRQQALQRDRRSVAMASRPALIERCDSGYCLALQVVVAVVGCEARLHHLVLSRPASRGGHIVDGRTVG